MKDKIETQYKIKDPTALNVHLKYLKLLYT